MRDLISNSSTSASSPEVFNSEIRACHKYEEGMGSTPSSDTDLVEFTTELSFLTYLFVVFIYYQVSALSLFLILTLYCHQPSSLNIPCGYSAR